MSAVHNPEASDLSKTPFWSAATSIIRVTDRFSDWFGYLVMLLFIPMILGGVYEVIMRYFFGAPTTWSGDVTFISNGAMFMLGSAYALLKGAHVRTDIFWDKFSEKTKGMIDFITYLILFLPIMGLIFFISWDAFMHSLQLNERSNAGLWQPIIWPFRAVVPLTMLLLFIQGISELLKSYWAVKTGHAYSQHEKIEI